MSVLALSEEEEPGTQGPRVPRATFVPLPALLHLPDFTTNRFRISLGKEI